MKIPSVKIVFDRKKKASKHQKGKLDLRITYERKQKFISTGISIYPDNWDERNQEVVNSFEAIELNSILQSQRRRVYKIIAEMDEAGKFDIDAIPTLLRGEKVNLTFLDYVFLRIEKSPVSKGTKAKYISLFNKLSEFGGIKFFRDVTEKNIRDFDEWLKNRSWSETNRLGVEQHKQYESSTIGTYHKNLKKFIADAVVDGYLQENVYIAKRIKIVRGNARIDKHLTIEELEKVKKAKMPTASLSVARDLFVFSCLTGLAYSDLCAFDVAKIKKEGKMCVYRSIRQKTKTEFVAPIPKEAMEILARYNNRLPKLPNQKFNMKLKVVADAAGIDKPISTHYARHTAASVWLNEGVPIAIISRALGHTNTAITEKVYSKMFDETMVEAFSKMEKSGRKRRHSKIEGK